MDSGALDQLDEILQLGGGGEQSATLDDGNVSQVLDVLPITRRSLTFARSTGLFFMTWRHVHAVADEIASSLNPYAVDAGSNSYPTDIPAGFDVWLLYCSLRRTNAAGALSAGIVELSQQSSFRAKGPALGTSLMALGFWDGIESFSGSFYATTPAGDTLIRPMIRLRRGSSIVLHTTSGAGATFQMDAVIAAMPAGLGQDGAS